MDARLERARQQREESAVERENRFDCLVHEVQEHVDELNRVLAKAYAEGCVLLASVEDVASPTRLDARPHVRVLVARL